MRVTSPSVSAFTRRQRWKRCTVQRLGGPVDSGKTLAAFRATVRRCCPSSVNAYTLAPLLAFASRRGVFFDFFVFFCWLFLK